jgi:predicted transcriptional regulator
MSEKNLSPETIEKLKSALQAETEKADNLQKEKDELQVKFDALSKEHE